MIRLSTKVLTAAFAAGVLLVSFSQAAIPTGYAGKPYPKGGVPHEIPGRINFRDYDIGGLNVTFYADDQAFGAVSGGGTAANRDKEGTGDNAWPAFFNTNKSIYDLDTFYAAGVVWPNGVRYPSATDTSISDWYIGASHPNSWTKWTVHVPKAGKYWISSIWTAADPSIQFHIIFMNGTQTVSTPTVSRTGTNSYHAWRQFNDFASIVLDSGVQVMQFQNGSMHLNQDFLYFAADSGNGITEVMQPSVPVNNTRPFKISLNQKTVRFSVSDAGMTKISVFDCLGREILPVMNRNISAGEHSVSLNSANLQGGVYFLHISHNGNTGVVKFQNFK